MAEGDGSRGVLRQRLTGSPATLVPLTGCADEVVYVAPPDVTDCELENPTVRVSRSSDVSRVCQEFRLYVTAPGSGFFNVLGNSYCRLFSPGNSDIVRERFVGGCDGSYFCYADTRFCTSHLNETCAPPVDFGNGAICQRPTFEVSSVYEPCCTPWRHAPPMPRGSAGSFPHCRFAGP